MDRELKTYVILLSFTGEIPVDPKRSIAYWFNYFMIPATRRNLLLFILPILCLVIIVVIVTVAYNGKKERNRIQAGGKEEEMKVDDIMIAAENSESLSNIRQYCKWC